MTTHPIAAVGPGGVWTHLVGQPRTAAILEAAAQGHGMTHAWLFTGPPGSGRSNAAVAFAAALQCERPWPRWADGGRCW
jgi:DNA polymerase III subunit delta'